jgi:transposase
MSDLTGVDSPYAISEALWGEIAPTLPLPKKKKKPGRPRMNDRKAMNAIFYILRTGCQWKDIAEPFEPRTWPQGVLSIWIFTKRN